MSGRNTKAPPLVPVHPYVTAAQNKPPTLELKQPFPQRNKFYVEAVFFNYALLIHGNHRHFVDLLNRMQFYQTICFSLKSIHVCHGIGHLNSHFFFGHYKINLRIKAVPKIAAIAIFAPECYRHIVFKQRCAGIDKEKMEQAIIREIIFAVRLLGLPYRFS